MVLRLLVVTCTKPQIYKACRDTCTVYGLQIKEVNSAPIQHAESKAVPTLILRANVLGMHLLTRQMLLSMFVTS